MPDIRRSGIPISDADLLQVRQLISSCQHGRVVIIPAAGSSLRYTVVQSVIPPPGEHPFTPPSQAATLTEADADLLRSALTLITALVGHIDFQNNVIADQSEESFLVARNQALRAALAPFAWRDFNPSVPDDAHVSVSCFYGRPIAWSEPNVGDFRRAAEVLHG